MSLVITGETAALSNRTPHIGPKMHSDPGPLFAMSKCESYLGLFLFQRTRPIGQHNLKVDLGRRGQRSDPGTGRRRLVQAGDARLPAASPRRHGPPLRRLSPGAAMLRQHEHVLVQPQSAVALRARTAARVKKPIC